MKLKIEYLNIKDITPYKNNAKIHTPEQIKQIKNSIKEFGMNDPIGIWSDKNIIVEGHGRLVACEQLGFKEVPVIRLDELTDEQRKAYTLAHNKLNMNTDFDLDILNLELEELNFTDIDMGDFGFDLDFDGGVFEKESIKNDDLELESFTEHHRLTTDRAYNLHFNDIERTVGYYQIPIIKNDDYIPKKLIGFNYAMTSKDKDTGIHFYIDDYQFERIWTSPERYAEILSDYDCMVTPDFSLYLDMPRAMKIWNVYRARLIGQIMQDYGIKVIPNVSWAEKETFDFCFDGIEKEGVVCISTIGVKQDKEALAIWTAGVTEMIKRLTPKTILVYGGKIDYEYPKYTQVIYFENQVTERMKTIKNKGE